MQLTKNELKIIEEREFYKEKFKVKGPPLFFPLYPMDLSLCSKYNKEILGKNTSLNIMHMELIDNETIFCWYLQKKELDDFASQIIENLKEKNYFIKLKRLIENENKKFEELITYLNSIKNQNLDSKGLIETYKKYMDALVHFRVFAMIPNTISLGENTMISNYKKSLSKKLSNEEFSTLTNFEKLTLSTLAEKDLLTLIINKKTDPQSLKDWIKKWGYIYYYYIGPLPSPNDVKNMIKELTKGEKSIEKRISEIENYPENVQLNKESLIKKLNLAPKDIHLLNVIAYLNYYKAERKELMQKSYVAVDNLFSKLKEITNLEINDLKFLTPEETKDLLNSNKNSNIAEIINKRKSVYFTITTPAEMKITSDKEQINNILKHIKTFTPTKKLVVACVGQTVKGRMIIINSKEDMEKIKQIKEPFILASSSTYPDLLPAMTKSAGIITQIGGMTSHASIVSREMKKPCIVGYSDLFEKFQEGDLIELNTKQGTVKLLKTAYHK